MLWCNVFFDLPEFAWADKRAYRAENSFGQQGGFVRGADWPRINEFDSGSWAPLMESRFDAPTIAKVAASLKAKRTKK